MKRPVFGGLLAALLLAAGTAPAQVRPGRPHRLPGRPPVPVRPGSNKARADRNKDGKVDRVERLRAAERLRRRAARKPPRAGRPPVPPQYAGLSRYEIFLLKHPELARQAHIKADLNGDGKVDSRERARLRLLLFKRYQLMRAREARRKAREFPGNRPGAAADMKRRLNRLGRGRLGPAELRRERLRRALQRRPRPGKPPLPRRAERILRGAGRAAGRVLPKPPLPPKPPAPGRVLRNAGRAAGKVLGRKGPRFRRTTPRPGVRPRPGRRPLRRPFRTRR